jgi:GDP-mannose transporter
MLLNILQATWAYQQAQTVFNINFSHGILPPLAGTLFSNIKVLVYSNVETFITFRSSTPLVLSVFDYIFLGRELPGGRSIFSILLLVASCGGYTYFDKGFRLEAYTWLCVW